MLAAYMEKEGVSLLGGTGVEEKDLLAVLPIFSCWMEKNPNANILDFFGSSKRISAKVTRALATIGLKAMVSELNTIALLSKNN
jgi:hypothetical protein